ncbi:MAG: beta-galactosidase [Lachnospiraceae bacterium]|nr:beta-galactosidase [Lachnospiraceae bacterium]
MEHKLKRILYGGDYNPNQWPREIWKQDMIFFKDAHINTATINVFSWAKIQPEENRYDFSELDDIVDMLSREGYDIILATSTAAMPAWLVKRYPEVARTDYEGRHYRFGERHNACPNSLVFQKYASKLADELAKRYGNRPNVTCWHISNEYGGVCYCENCAKAFRVWLKKKYQTLDRLNEAWNTEFWGHTFYDWDEIVPPNQLGDGLWGGNTAFAGMSIDYMRFNSDGMLDNFKMEKAAIRKHDRKTPITTNLMGTYKELDYFKWAKEMDVVSWDNYPSYNTPWSRVAMTHDLMRGLKNAPFILMEQTPSQQNWQAYNSLKRPGQMRAQSYQTIAHGADSILFFQLRRSKGGCEKFHGAVISHAQTENTRVFREVAELGAELEQLGTKTIGSVNQAEVGMIFDWENFWAVEYTSGPSVNLKYVDQISRYYQYFYDKNIGVDMVSVEGDFSKYKMLVAPVLYMIKDGVKERLEQFVKNGGVLVTTMMSGIVDQSDNVHLGGYPGPLREMAGVWVEEIDALAPTQSNRLVFNDGSESSCGMLCDVIHPETAEVIANYGEDFYQGTPAVTRNAFGSGCVYYIGTVPENAGIGKVLDLAVQERGVHSVIEEETKLEVTVRSTEDADYIFLINFTDEQQKVPESLIGLTDLLTGDAADSTECMKKYDVKLLKKERNSENANE